MNLGVRVAAQGDSGNGSETAANRGAGLTRSGLLDPVSQAENPEDEILLSPCWWTAEPARGRTGIKFLRDGEWQDRKHDFHGRRQRREAHLSMNTANSNIRPVEFTPSLEGDSPVLPDPLCQPPDDEDIGTVTEDGAYDTRSCDAAIIARGGTTIIPTPKNGRPSKEDCPAALKQECAARSPSEGASPQGTPTAKPPKSTSGLHSTTASMLSALPRLSAWLESKRERGQSRLKPQFCNKAPSLAHNGSFEHSICQRQA